jgi:hypothetical protein
VVRGIRAVQRGRYGVEAALDAGIGEEGLHLAEVVWAGGTHRGDPVNPRPILSGTSSVRAGAGA